MMPMKCIVLPLKRKGRRKRREKREERGERRKKKKKKEKERKNTLLSDSPSSRRNRKCTLHLKLNFQKNITLSSKQSHKISNKKSLVKGRKLKHNLGIMRT